MSVRSCWLKPAPTCSIGLPRHVAPSRMEYVGITPATFAANAPTNGRTWYSSVVPGERREAAVVVVAVEPLASPRRSRPSASRRSSTPPVSTPLRAVLESLDVRAHHPAGERGVLAEGAVDAAPARLGREIRLRRQRHLDADGAILLPRDVAEAPHERRVADRREPERLRPLRELPRRDARAEHVLEVVARIGADRERDAEPRSLGDLLQRVVLRGERSPGSPPSRVIMLLTFAPSMSARFAAVSYPVPTPAPPIGPPLRAVPCIIAPAFSSSVICDTRSRARAAGVRRQSSYGSSWPLRLRSRNLRPDDSMIGVTRARRELAGPLAGEGVCAATTAGAAAQTSIRRTSLVIALSSGWVEE